MSIRIEYLYCERASPPSHRAAGFTCIFYFLCMFYAKFYAGFEGLSRRPFSSLQKLSCKITLCSFVGWNPRTNRLVRAIFMTFKVVDLLICIFKTVMTPEPEKSQQVFASLFFLTRFLLFNVPI